jgi:hypothetical protein
MTLTGRNITIRSGLALCGTITVAVLLHFVWNLRHGYLPVELRNVQIVALIGAAVTVVLGFLFSGVYARLFRRSPSIPVFFLTLFFLSITLDITKLAQLVVRTGSSQYFSLLVGRASIFGHIVGVMALFVAGLYAGGIRMQRHGTVVLVGLLIAFSLSWLIPVDTSYLPDHLVYPAGVKASFQSALLVFHLLAVLNFIQAAIVNQNPRMAVTALAVAFLAAGREILFFSVSPVWIVIGGGAVVVGGVVFTGQYYRDFLVS